MVYFGSVSMTQSNENEQNQTIKIIANSFQEHNSDWGQTGAIDAGVIQQVAGCKISNGGSFGEYREKDKS